jgi:signal transduction histidine kinase
MNLSEILGEGRLMKTTALEPGLYSIFRLFAGLRLAITLLGLVSYLVLTSLFHDLPREPNPVFHWLSLADACLMMAYLSWPGLQQRMGRYFLPVGLAIATLGPILEQAIALRAQAGLAMVDAGSVLQPFLLLFIPLVLISWQYNFRMVILFSLATGLLDWILLMTTFDVFSLQLLPLVGSLFLRTVTYIVVGYMVVSLMRTQREQRRALAEANRQLTHYAAALEQLATSRERNRLARELHDTLAHSLSGVAVQLEGVKTLWAENPPAAHEMLEHSLAATRSGLTETRRALQALRATPLEDLGLALAIRSLAESMAARNGLAVEVAAPERLENLSPDMEQGIYRVAQEALENVALHAQASRVKVDLSQEEGQVLLAISDDGRGFDPASVDTTGRFGLQGMRERTEMLGGRLEVDSRPGVGTTVRLAWSGAA